jgi:hypothetical protein
VVDPVMRSHLLRARSAPYFIGTLRGNLQGGCALLIDHPDALCFVLSSILLQVGRIGFLLLFGFALPSMRSELKD